MPIIDNEISRLRIALDKGDLFNRSISAVGTFWHIDHSLKVILSVHNMLEESNPATYRWKFNWLRHLILSTGFIPRGKARAPKSVLPPTLMTKADIEHQLNQAIAKLETITTFPAKAHFIHPYFGDIPLKTSIRFLKVHTRHHLKIIRDITKDPS